MKVEFYTVDEHRNPLLKYALMVCRTENGQWLFVRHKERSTWEIPAGHIEAGEHPNVAARRELYEETGAVVYTIEAMSDYSVDHNGLKTFGRIYFADIEKLGELPEFEIAEIMLSSAFPEHNTYPAIQPKLFEYILKKKAISPPVK